MQLWNTRSETESGGSSAGSCVLPSSRRGNRGIRAWSTLERGLLLTHANSVRSHKKRSNICQKKPAHEHTLSIAICSRCRSRSFSICLIASSPLLFCASRACVCVCERERVCACLCVCAWVVIHVPSQSQPHSKYAFTHTHARTHTRTHTHIHTLPYSNIPLHLLGKGKRNRADVCARERGRKM
jgi:hypothetical protein